MTKAEKIRARAQNMRQIPFYQELRAKGVGAADAVQRVRRHWAFMADLSATIRAHKKRQKAAKKGWKTRRANAL